jgi:hypothetical protein
VKAGNKVEYNRFQGEAHDTSHLRYAFDQVSNCQHLYDAMCVEVFANALNKAVAA